MAPAWSSLSPVLGKRKRKADLPETWVPKEWSDSKDRFLPDVLSKLDTLWHLTVKPEYHEIHKLRKATKTFKAGDLQQVEEYLSAQALNMWVHMCIQFSLVSPVLLTKRSFKELADDIATGHWTNGVSHPGSAFSCGYDIIVDNDVYIKYKALFDMFFAASRFGVLKAEYLGDLLTTEREVLEYDPDYFGGLSPVFDFKRHRFMRWSRDSFRNGYSAQVRLPLGPRKHRWTERVCWAVIAPHLRIHAAPPASHYDLGEDALCSLRAQQPSHMAITVAHPMRECYFFPDHASPSSLTYDALAGLSNNQAVSYKRQLEHQRAAARRAGADDNLDAPEATTDTDSSDDDDDDDDDSLEE